MTDPIIVYTTVSKPDANGFRGERMALHPNLPLYHVADGGFRPYRVAWRIIWAGGVSGWRLDDRLFSTVSTPEALAWLLEGEKK